MRQVIDEFVLVPRGEAAERINGTMTLSETAAFIYEHLEEAIKVRDKKANTVNEQDNPLGYEKESKLLVGFAIPCIISMLVTALYNIVDQIFIGQGVGMLGNAATNIAFPLSTSCTAISLLLGIGSATNFSLKLGAGEEKESAEYAGNGICLMAIFGIALFAVTTIFLTPMLKFFGATSEVLPYAQEYTRITAIGFPFLIANTGMSKLILADGSPRYSMTSMLVGAIVNTILDPIFIFGLHMGMRGAALATIIGQIVSFCISLRYMFHFKTIRLTKESFHMTGRHIENIFKFGASACFNQIAMTIVQIVLNNSLTYYGALSPYGKAIPLAACGIVMKTNAILLAVIIGISQGSQPIIGFNYGAKQYDRVRGVYKLAIQCNLVISLIGFLLFQLCPRQIISLFGTGDALYFEFAVKFMRIFLFMVLLNGVQLLSSNFFAAIGKPVKGMLLSLTRQVFFLIPLLFILPLFLGIDGIMYAGPVADAIAFLTSVFLISREMKKMKLAKIAK